MTSEREREKDRVGIVNEKAKYDVHFIRINLFN